MLGALSYSRVYAATATIWLQSTEATWLTPARMTRSLFDDDIHDLPLQTLGAPMRRTLTIAVAPALLLAGLLSGCGSDGDSSSSSGDYCDIAKSIKDDVNGIDLENLDDATFNQLQDNLNQLEAAAPDNVQEDWALLSDKFAELDNILSDAGLSLDDLSELQAGQLPEGVDMAKLQEMSTKMQEFSDTTEIDPAIKNIEKSLKDDCGIDTEESGS